MPPRTGQDPDPTRVPPHDLEAEAAVLGACMLSSEAVATARRVITDDLAWYRPAHARIWRAIVGITERNEAVDALTVGAELRRTDTLGDLTSNDLIGLISAAPGIAHTGTYAQLIVDHALLRQVIGAAATITEQAYAGPADPASFAAQARSLLEDVAGRAQHHGSTLRIPDLGEIIDGGVTTIDPDFLTRTDGKRLLYAGRMHVIQAEPTLGKTWVALLATVELLRAGGSVVYIDWEDSAAGLVGRLLAQRAQPNDIRERFTYIQPEGPIGPAERAELEQRVADMNPELVILDGVAEALVRDGLDENAASDFVQWAEKLPRWLTRTGAAVVMLDHVTKASEHTPSRYARGSGAKLAVVDGASYTLKLLSPYSRQKAGKVQLTVAKDRPGGIGAIGEAAAVMHITPAADGELVDIELRPPDPAKAADGQWRPTIIMGQISKLLIDQGPMRANEVVDSFSLQKPTLVRKAIHELLHEKAIVEEKIGRHNKLRSLRPFGHDHGDEPDPGEPPSDLELFPPPEPAGSVTDLNDWKDRNL